MNNDIQLFLLSVGGALVAGFVLGALVGALLQRGAARPAPIYAPVGNEILRIDGDPAEQKLLLRVAGALIDSADSIADVEVREHVRALMRLLGPDAPAPASAPDAAAAAPSPSAATWTAPSEPRASLPALPPPAIDAGAPSQPEEPDDLSAPFLTRLTASLRPQVPVAPLKPKPAPVVRAPKVVPAGPPPADMFEQINVILQRKLAGQPQAPDIKLFGEDGGLRILVGHDVFRSVEDVTDARVRGWIREAVAEWEAR